MHAEAVSATVFDRRLHFVVGKGGVGKTTVAAALARLQADRGRRTLAIELDVAGRLPTLLGHPGPAATPVEVRPGLHVLTVDGRTALEEYLGLIIPVRRLLQTVFASNVYQYFVAAAPGLKELMSIGKIWYEATREEDGRRVWDMIVVDAPATGHSLQLLRMPQAARDTFATGLVQREASKIVDFLRDPRTTAVHVVTLAEEMPATEALESRAEIVDHLGLPFGHLVVNRVHRRAFSPSLLERLARAAEHGAAGERAMLTAVHRRAVEEASWTAINHQHLARLADIGPRGGLVTLPFLFVEEFDDRALAEVARALGEGVGMTRAVAAGGPS